MAIWRIRYQDNDGRLRAIYHEQSMKPTMAEAYLAIQYYLMTTGRDKDSPPQREIAVKFPRVIRIDRLPSN
jgi:hypothetical protein